MKKIIFASLLLTTGAVNAATLTNGSLSGQISNGGVPTGWTAYSGSPDTMNENNNVGGPYGSFGATPSASSDGGTWVGLARNGNFNESFGQTISDFSIGTSYDLSWEHSNFGYSTYNGANAIEVFLDGASIGSGSLLSLGTAWMLESISFTATKLSHQISFRLREVTKSYHGIDGISLSAATPAVPVPAALLMFAPALLGFLGLRRKAKA